MTTSDAIRSTVADVDLDAIASNVEAIRARAKADASLTRLGAPAHEAAARYRAIGSLPHIEIDGIFTHFATADDPETTNDGVQLERFREVLRSIPDRPRLVHAAASAGVAAFGSVEGMTVVRTGLSIYGLHAAPHLENALALRPALTWRSRVHRIATVPAGTGVSYGHEYRLPRDGRIATVPVGYGDGLPRVAGESGTVGLRGRHVPFAGRTGTGLLLLDVTRIDA